MTTPTTAADELNALRRIVAILDKLDPGAQDRAITWLEDRYATTPESCWTDMSLNPTAALDG